MSEWGYVAIGVAIGIFLRPNTGNRELLWRLIKIERKVDWLADNAGWKPPAVDKEIADLIFEGRKLEAIKVYRSRTGQGLKECKDAIDDIERQLKGS